MGVGPEEIANVRFTPVRIHDGYDMDLIVLVIVLFVLLG